MKGVPQSRTYPILLREGEDGFILAECPVFQGCFTQGETIADAMANIKEAIELCLDDEQEIAPEAGFLMLSQVTVEA